MTARAILEWKTAGRALSMTVLKSQGPFILIPETAWARMLRVSKVWLLLRASAMPSLSTKIYTKRCQPKTLNSESFRLHLYPEFQFPGGGAARKQAYRSRGLRVEVFVIIESRCRGLGVIGVRLRTLKFRVQVRTFGLEDLTCMLGCHSCWKGCLRHVQETVA